MKNKIGFENIDCKVPNFGSLNIFYSTGGMYESEGTRGISHLAEHLIAESYKDIYEDLDAFGISNNATTSNTHVMFYFNGLNENLQKFEEKILRLLAFIPTKEQFEKEKEIVLREYSDTISKKSMIYLNIMRAYYNNFCAIGYKKDIEEITYEQYLEFHKTNFSNPTYILRVGDTKLNDVYSNLTFTENIPNEFKMQEKNESVIEHEISSKQLTITDWFEIDLPNYKISLITEYLSGGLTSPFYKRLREELNLVYYVGMGMMELNDKVVLFTSTECAKNKNKVIRKELKNIMSNIHKIINESRFERIKMMELSNCKKVNIFNFQHSFANHKYLNSETYEEDVTNYSYDSFKLDIVNFCETYNKNIKHAEYGRSLKI